MLALKRENLEDTCPDFRVNTSCSTESKSYKIASFVHTFYWLNMLSGWMVEAPYLDLHARVHKAASISNYWHQGSNKNASGWIRDNYGSKHGIGVSTTNLNHLTSVSKNGFILISIDIYCYHSLIFILINISECMNVGNKRAWENQPFCWLYKVNQSFNQSCHL